MTTTPPRRFDPSVEQEIGADAATEPLLRRLLAGLEDLGYLLIPPGGAKRGYLNVRPSGNRGGRVLAINATTGRAEFQTGSWERVGSTDYRFVRLEAGDKAAHPLESMDDVHAVLKAAEIELGYRGGHPSPRS